MSEGKTEETHASSAEGRGACAELFCSCGVWSPTQHSASSSYARSAEWCNLLPALPPSRCVHPAAVAIADTEAAAAHAIDAAVAGATLQRCSVGEEEEEGRRAAQGSAGQYNAADADHYAPGGPLAEAAQAEVRVARAARAAVRQATEAAEAAAQAAVAAWEQAVQSAAEAAAARERAAQSAAAAVAAETRVGECKKAEEVARGVSSVGARRDDLVVSCDATPPARYPPVASRRAVTQPRCRPTRPVPPPRPARSVVQSLPPPLPPSVLHPASPQQEAPVLRLASAAARAACDRYRPAPCEPSTDAVPAAAAVSLSGTDLRSSLAEIDLSDFEHRSLRDSVTGQIRHRLRAKSREGERCIA